MQLLAKYKTLLMLIGLALVVWLFSSYADSLNLSHAVSLRAEDVRAQTESLERDLIFELEQVGTIRLDERLFASDSWMVLSDWSQQLPAPILERPDPFAPIVSTGS